MSDETHDLSGLEQALQGLQPTSGLDRDALMFEAGRAAAASSRAHWFWPASTAAALLLAAGLLSARWFEVPRERIVHVQVTAPQPELPAVEPPLPDADPRDEAASRVAALSLRLEVLRNGIDSLPAPEPVPPARQVSIAELLR